MKTKKNGNKIKQDLRNLTPFLEEAWRLSINLYEQQEFLDERFAEIDRLFKENDRQFQETDRLFKETDRLFKETNTNITAISENSKRIEAKVDKILELLVEKNNG